MKVTIAQFASEAHAWYPEYTKSDYFKGRGNIPGHLQLEATISAKASSTGYLDVDDLVAIAVWGGAQHGIHRQVRDNSNSAVQRVTGVALANVDTPGLALHTPFHLEHWGLTYATKTLMFAFPKQHAALDSHIRSATAPFLPPIRDGDLRSMVRGYVAFLEVCAGLRRNVKSPGPRGGSWYTSDIESALFQFTSDGNSLDK